MVPLSILDLVPIVDGGDAARALRNSLDLAQHAERWGYRRFWLAEHHNTPGVASAATSVIIGHIAAGTSKIRVGAGGIMLGNHAPLVIAEQFGTLEALFAGRIDLGLGRARGGSPLTARALRRAPADAPADFENDVRALMAFFNPSPTDIVRAVPGAGLQPPLWILGTSLVGAALAASLGLPYAYAAHFAPSHLAAAVALYRGQFKPAAWLAKPHVMVSVNVFAAETDRAARRLFTSLEQAFANQRRGSPTTLPAPTEDFAPAHAATPVDPALSQSIIGGPDAIHRGLRELVARTGADELMVTAQIFDHQARLRSFELTARAAAD